MFAREILRSIAIDIMRYRNIYAYICHEAWGYCRLLFSQTGRVSLLISCSRNQRHASKPAIWTCCAEYCDLIAITVLDAVLHSNSTTANVCDVFPYIDLYLLHYKYPSNALYHRSNPKKIIEPRILVTMQSILISDWTAVYQHITRGPVYQHGLT